MTKNDKSPPAGDKDKRVFGVDLAKKGNSETRIRIVGEMKEAEATELAQRDFDLVGNLIPGDTVAEKVANLRMARIQAERLE